MFRLAAALLLFAPVVVGQTPGGLIGGVVRNAWSKTALRRAVVTLTTTGNNPLDAVTYSDSNGAFGFTGVPAGDYYLCVEYPAYQRTCLGASDPGQPVPTVTLVSGQKKNDIVLAMLPLGSVSGTVTDSNGDPLLNVSVSMLQPIYARRTLHWQPVNQAITNDRGEYHISFVKPGQYRLMASLQQFQPGNRMQSDVTNGQKLIDDIEASQFYPNAADIGAAVTLSLSAGNDLKSIDFSLTAVYPALVTGRVILPPDCDRNEFVNLLMTPATPGLLAQQYNANAPPGDYNFQFQGVPQGRYKLTAMMTSKNRTYRSSQTIDAAPGANEVTVSLQQGAPLSGHLKVLGGTTQDHSPYRVHLFWGEDVPFFNQQPETEVQPDGSFHFDDVVAGIWDIGVLPQPPGSYIQSMMLGNKDVLTDDMTLTGSERPSLEVVLDLNGAMITGSVEPADPLPGGVASKSFGRAMVLLAPEGKFDNVLSFYEVVESDRSGKFEFKSVTPGRYKIYAFDHMRFEEHWNPDFLKPYASLGEAFDVGEGAHLDRQTKLIIRGAESNQ